MSSRLDRTGWEILRDNIAHQGKLFQLRILRVLERLKGDLINRIGASISRNRRKMRDVALGEISARLNPEQPGGADIPGAIAVLEELDSELDAAARNAPVRKGFLDWLASLEK